MTGTVGGTDGDRSGSPDSDLLALCREIREHPQTIELSDGRQLCYATVGDPDGEPLVLAHGHPNSRVFAAIFDDVATELGVQIVAPDRTGVGRSDGLDGRRLGDWPTDVAQLLDALEIDTAPVLGVSAGGPYALACGASIPERVPRVGVICPVGPSSALGLRNRIPFFVGRFVPSLWGRDVKDRRDAARADPTTYLEAQAEDAPEPDRPLWRGEFGHALMLGTAEGTRDGIDGYVRDAKLLCSPWDFDPADISVPVVLRHGTADELVPVAMGRRLASEIPDVDADFLDDLGHLAIIEETKEDVMREICGI